MPAISPRAKSIALFASVALNVLLVSAVATYAVDKWYQGRDRSTVSRIERMAQRLPGPDGDKLRRSFTVHAKDLPTARQELRMARDAFRQALAADPYDPVAVEKVLAQLDASRAKVRQMVRATVVSAAAEMSAEGRRRLADSAKRR